MKSEVWASLPPEAVENKGFFYQVKDPVVLLKLALYGHPDSPTFWEMHCEGLIITIGFEP